MNLELLGISSRAASGRSKAFAYIRLVRYPVASCDFASLQIVRLAIRQSEWAMVRKFANCKKAALMRNARTCVMHRLAQPETAAAHEVCPWPFSLVFGDRLTCGVPTDANQRSRLGPRMSGQRLGDFFLIRSPSSLWPDRRAVRKARGSRSSHYNTMLTHRCSRFSGCRLRTNAVVLCQESVGNCRPVHVWHARKTPY